MIRNKHKVLSVVLCLALVVCAFFALSLSANAASGDTIYVKVNNGWSCANFYCYMWNGSGGEGYQNAAWPGTKMTLVDSTNNIFSYTLPQAYENIIFTNGSGDQTKDAAYTGGDGQLFDLKAGTWSQYVQPTSGNTPATQPTQATTPSGSGTIVFFRNTANWQTPRCYMWNSNSDTNAGWPGAAMTLVEDNVWMYAASKTFANCIFNPGGDDGKTSDLKNIQSGYLYDYQSGSWEPYDLSPLQIKAFSADPAANIYTGMEITLSTTAVSSEGDVSYQFAVNGATIRDYSAESTATWTPTAAGTYTIAFNVKDTNGNENQRTLSLTVASDANVSKPIIKKVTPSDSSYVKLNTASAINVTAGGGVTGTNLLFYKYVIEDPTGATNTPYYTLNNTYNFTPNKEGAYKVTVYVQASDNTTVNKTVTVNVTSGDIPTQGTTVKPVTQPTTVAPVTQPTTLAPVTQPTTVAPVTQPTTVAPVTQPTTVAPVTQPTTVAPVTQPTTPSTFALGDVNMDGRVSIKDVTHIQLFLAEYTGFDVTLELGDLNGDGSVTVRDATTLQYILAEYY